MKKRIEWMVMMAAALSFCVGILFSGFSILYAGPMVPAAKVQKKADDIYDPKVNKPKEMLPDVRISLTYPAGESPKVFTKGWVFGASCIVNPGTREQGDISHEVRWKGTGTFNPGQGPLSRSAFNSPGPNQIILSCRGIEKTFTVQAVDPKGYARLGDIARGVVAFGCPACPHTVQGPISLGSPNVFIDGLPAARVGDTGQQAGSCGPNFFVIMTGDSNVLIDGKPAARFGDRTDHHGGMGSIITGYGKP